MENLFFAKVGIAFGKKKFPYLFLVITSFLLLAACANSNVSRDAAANVDFGVQNARSFTDNLSDGGGIGDSYQNTSQATKGALIGGIAGAATGAAYSSIGFLPGTAIGLLLGATYGSYIDVNTSLEDKLENRGAKVVVLGDQVLIVIPSARIFDGMTSTIKPQAYSTLNQVSEYINHFTKMLVKISAFTNDNGSIMADTALSQEQADSIAKYLTATGVQARMLYSAGYGGAHLVQKNSNIWYGNDNYRIEITLEKQYV